MAGTVELQPGDVDKRAMTQGMIAGALGVLLLVVPPAFAAGWRLGRTMGRLSGR